MRNSPRATRKTLQSESDTYKESTWKEYAWLQNQILRVELRGASFESTRGPSTDNGDVYIHKKGLPLCLFH